MPPPSAPHPAHHNVSPGVQSLPVEFDRLNLNHGAAMPPHVGHDRMPPPPMGGLGHLGHEFDTALLQKQKDSYEGYNFERIPAQHPHEKATWALVTKTKMPLGQSELLAMVNKQKRKGRTAWQLLKSDEMKGFKRKQVDQLIDDRKRAEPRFNFELAGLKLDQHTDKRRGTIGTTAFQIILKRQLRKDWSASGPGGLGKLHEPHRETIDLTGGSEDPSEGSSRDFFGGSSPPPHHFVPPPPDHGFPDHHGFGQPPQQPPFIHQPGPPVHEIHHDVHHGPQHPLRMPQFEDPFVHQDPHEAHPPPPFVPPMPHHMPPDEGYPEEYKEPKQKKDQKDSKDSKPKIHQTKPHKSEKKHKKVPSESDWDYISESSDFSQAYTDRTPDTVYSSNSSRKDKKGYHKGRDSRRSSRSHQDEYERERHDAVYRVHRRKPTMSPDRSRPSGRSRHETEEIEVIPATHMPKARPYLTRSRTSAHRSERLPEHPDRPIFHSRHISYHDDRPHHGFRDLTPPGRRVSILASERTQALDLYDAREEQERLERLEREEIRLELLRKERRKEERLREERLKEELLREERWKGELLREERRKDEVREGLARQLEREAAEMRRPVRHDRGISSDRLYEERPGRYSRGYDNDRSW